MQCESRPDDPILRIQARIRRLELVTLALIEVAQANPQSFNGLYMATIDLLYQFQDEVGIDDPKANSVPVTQSDHDL